MQLNMTPEDIDELVKQTILKSGIGKAIEQAVSKSLGGYDSPIDRAVKEVVTQQIVLLLQTEYKDKVEASVRKAIEARITDDILEKIAGAAISKIESAARDRY